MLHISTFFLFLVCYLTDQAALELLFLHIESHAASRHNFVTFVILGNYMLFS